MKPKAEPVVIVTKKRIDLKKFLSDFHTQLGVALLGLIVLVLIFGYVFHKINQNKVVVVCSSSTIQQALADLNSGNNIQLSTLVSNFKNNPNYIKDSNCEYIVAAYNVNIDNTTVATSSLSQVNKDIAKIKLNSQLTNYLSLSQLQQNITQEDSSYNQLQHNSSVLTPPNYIQTESSKR